MHGIWYAYLISIHNLVIYKHILIIEKYYMIISIGVKDNVMHTVSWWNTDFVETQY